MPALEDVLAAHLQTLDEAHQRRVLREAESLGDMRIKVDGKSYLNFSSNDYFGLSDHPEVLAAAKEALIVGGAGASRLLTGNHTEYQILERRLAKLHGCEAAIVFGSGYLANIGTISSLAGKGDVILADKLSHACMVDGAKLSDATFKRFAHNDLAHLETLLKAHRAEYRHCLILTETVFSMDGDRAPLTAVKQLAEQYDAWLMTDDAHGVGLPDVENQANIKMGTLSKGIGAYGGYVCGSQTLIDYLVNYARSFVFTTALPASVVAAASKAIEIMGNDKQRCARPLSLAQQFTAELGLPMAQSPIVPLVLGESKQALQASEQLKCDGYWVSAIRPPTVPKGTARLRFSFSTAHKEDDITALTTTIRGYEWFKHLGLKRLDATG